MRKLLCSLALFAAVGVLVASATPSAPAQQKDKKSKKTDKKDAAKDTPNTVEVYEVKDGWRFRVIGPDGKSLAIGVQSYAKKEDCLAAVDVLKATMTKAKVTEETKEKKKD